MKARRVKELCPSLKAAWPVWYQLNKGLDENRPPDATEDEVKAAALAAGLNTLAKAHFDIESRIINRGKEARRGKLTPEKSAAQPPSPKASAKAPNKPQTVTKASDQKRDQPDTAQGSDVEPYEAFKASLAAASQPEKIRMLRNPKNSVFKARLSRESSREHSIGPAECADAAKKMDATQRTVEPYEAFKASFAKASQPEKIRMLRDPKNRVSKARLSREPAASQPADSADESSGTQRETEDPAYEDFKTSLNSASRFERIRLMREPKNRQFRERLKNDPAERMWNSASCRA